MAVQLSDELVEFIESGVSTLVATRSAELRPECVRAAGSLVAPSRDRLTVFVAETVAKRTLANLADNHEIAVTLSRPMDHRTLQVKGTCVEVRPATVEERAVQERYLASFVEQLYWVGMARALTRRLAYTPAVALTFEVRDVFVQTPGPGAGRRLEAR